MLMFYLPIIIFGAMLEAISKQECPCIHRGAAKHRLDPIANPLAR